MLLTTIDIMQLILIVLICISAILAIELKRILHAIIALWLMSTLLAILYWILNAPLVALIQLTVYSGLIIVLFLAFLTMRSGEENENKILKIVSITLTMVILLFIGIFTMNFPLFAFRKTYGLINPPNKANEGLYHALWNFRQLDLLIQAILLFTASVACVAILGIEIKEGGRRR